MPTIYQQKQFSKPTSTVGATGSGKVSYLSNTEGQNSTNIVESWYGQLKPPILFADQFRKKKARYLDAENFSEIISANILRATASKEEQALIPEVSFVIYPSQDNKKSQVGVISHYVPNGKGDLIDKSKYPNFKDTPFVYKENPNPNNPFELNDSQRITLLKGIARSILVGDHDINPGNFVINKMGEIARIDFGHAFNDLIKHTKVRNTDNQVLDYINRDRIDTIFGNPTPKLWRSFENFIPSLEFADALAETAQESELTIKNGIQNAKDNFNNLLRTGNVDKEQVLKSLISVANNLGNPKIRIPYFVPLTVNKDKYINDAFYKIQEFTEKQARDMKKTANLMRAQVALDNILKDTNIEESEVATSLENWSKVHEIDLKEKITWIKASKDTPAVVGTVRDYIKASSKRLGIDEQKRIERTILSNTTLLPKTGLLSRLKNISFPNKIKSPSLLENHSSNSVTLSKANHPHSSLEATTLVTTASSVKTPCVTTARITHSASKSSLTEVKK